MAICILAAGLAAARSEDEFARDVRPLLAKYCFDCHGAEKQKAGVNLSRFSTEADLEPDQPIWLDVLAQLQGYTMPPAKAAQPAEEERSRMAAWLSGAMDRIDDRAPRNPGSPVIHRLNRVEYDNTIRDLFNIDFHAADDFPADDTAHGFDNVADVLTLQPLLLEKYLAAAERIVENLFSSDAVEPIDQSLNPASWRNAKAANGTAQLPLEQEIGTTIQIPASEEYELQVHAHQIGSPIEPAALVLKINGVDTHLWLLPVESRREVLSARITMLQGAHRLSLRHTSHIQYPKGKSAPDIKLFVEDLRLSGPIRSLAHQRLLAPGLKLENRNAAENILDAFATNAFRRPLTTGELAPFLALYDNARSAGTSHSEALRLPFVAMLVAPQFLFRIESGSGTPDANNAVRVSDFELANRLSYFLWSTMPDQELFRLAGEEKLRDPEILRQQVQRMLAHPKSAAFMENFAGQWLALRRFETAAPDRDLFPSFKPALRSAMAAEPLLFFERIVREDRSILDFLNSDWTILNEELARHYGIKNITGGVMRPVSLAPGSPRGGVMSMAAVLTVTSHPTRTSAVKRGKWVLEELLGAPPPPPPPDVPDLVVPKKGERSAVSLRERLERHREDPQCFGCHVRMDALGLALENFDAIGRWRDKDGEHKIDASGQLPGGESFNGPAELKTVLAAHKDEFVRSFTEKMLVYALGRGLERYDRREIKRITRAMAENDFRFSTLVTEIVASYPFQYRAVQPSTNL